MQFSPFQNRSSIPNPPSEIYCNEPFEATVGRFAVDAQIPFSEANTIARKPSGQYDAEKEKP
jgi:hypothetical protein